MATTATKFITTTEDRVNLLPVSNGQVIFVRDSRKICLDYQDIRTEYGQIIVLTDENHRLSIANPFNTFYFVLDTHVLWHFDKQWIPLTTPPKQEVIFVGSYEDLPTTGVSGILYTTDKDIYVWNGEAYTKIGALCWGEF